MKEAYAEKNEQLDEVLVFKQEFMNMQDVFMMGLVDIVYSLSFIFFFLRHSYLDVYQNRNGASPTNSQYHNRSENTSNVAPARGI